MQYARRASHPTEKFNKILFFFISVFVKSEKLRAVHEQAAMLAIKLEYSSKVEKKERGKKRW